MWTAAGSSNKFKLQMAARKSASFTLGGTEKTLRRDSIGALSLKHLLEWFEHLLNHRQTKTEGMQQRLLQQIFIFRELLFWSLS